MSITETEYMEQYILNIEHKYKVRDTYLASELGTCKNEEKKVHSYNDILAQFNTKCNETTGSIG